MWPLNLINLFISSKYITYCLYLFICTFELSSPSSHHFLDELYIKRYASKDAVFCGKNSWISKKILILAIGNLFVIIFHIIWTKNNSNVKRRWACGGIDDDDENAYTTEVSLWTIPYETKATRFYFNIIRTSNPHTQKGNILYKVKGEIEQNKSGGVYFVRAKKEVIRSTIKRPSNKDHMVIFHLNLNLKVIVHLDRCTYAHSKKVYMTITAVVYS